MGPIGIEFGSGKLMIQNLELECFSDLEFPTNKCIWSDKSMCQGEGEGEDCVLEEATSVAIDQGEHES